MNKDEKTGKKTLTNSDFQTIEKSGAEEVHESRSHDSKLAKSESDKFTDDEVKGKQYSETLHIIALFFIWFFCVLLVILIIVRFVHLVIPDCWYWLECEQLCTIDKIIYSGIILSFAADYFKKFNLLGK